MNSNIISREKWNKRADSWENKRRNGDSSSDRLFHTMEYIKKRELISSDSIIADIGSGPCRFAVEFARIGAHVSCFDISDRMLEYGRQYASENNITNIDYHCCSFSELDISNSGFEAAFDLVFSSLTPAIDNEASLLKMTAMSRAYCLDISHIYRHNSIEDGIREELFKDCGVSKSFDYSFLNTFNLLYKNGYNPEADYDYRTEAKSFVPDQYVAEIIMEHVLPIELQNSDNHELIWNWLKNHMDKDGRITQELKSCYGRILWDKRINNRRSDEVRHIFV